MTAATTDVRLIEFSTHAKHRRLEAADADSAERWKVIIHFPTELEHAMRTELAAGIQLTGEARAAVLEHPLYKPYLHKGLPSGTHIDNFTHLDWRSISSRFYLVGRDLFYAVRDGNVTTAVHLDAYQRSALNAALGGRPVPEVSPEIGKLLGLVRRGICPLPRRPPPPPETSRILLPAWFKNPNASWTLLALDGQPDTDAAVQCGKRWVDRTFQHGRPEPLLMGSSQTAALAYLRRNLRSDRRVRVMGLPPFPTVDPSTHATDEPGVVRWMEQVFGPSLPFKERALMVVEPATIHCILRAFSILHAPPAQNIMSGTLVTIRCRIESTGLPRLYATIGHSP